MNMLVKLEPSTLKTTDELEDQYLMVDELEAKYASQGEHDIFRISDWTQFIQAHLMAHQHHLNYWGWVHAMLARIDLDPRDLRE